MTINKALFWLPAVAIILALVLAVAGAPHVAYAGITPTPVPPTATPLPLPTPTPDPVDRRADPVIQKTINTDSAAVGDIVIFTITVGNIGDKQADDVVVTDSVPNELEIVEVASSRGTASVSGQDVTVVIGAVVPKEVVTITIRARVSNRVKPGDSITNTASLTCSNRSDVISNNTNQITFRISVPRPMPTPTLTPNPNALLPTPVVAPVPVPPAQLPVTGAPDSSAAWLLLVAIGMLLFGMRLRRN